ncbi:MAG: N-acetylmuramoyl-L-alanine amidase [Balneolaceae bacterium]
MKYLLTLFTFLLLSTIALSQTTDELFLHVTIPEEDTTIVPFSRYRVAAGTHPDARAFINNEEVKVYANGAFAKLLELSVEDTVKLEFKVTMDGETITKEMVFIRPVTPYSEPLRGKTITDRMVLPNNDIWLKTGDVLEVQFLGSPNEKAVFNIDGFKRNIPMKELPAEQANGIRGVYVGKYEVMPGDYVDKKHITFKIKAGLLSYVKKKSKAVVSFNGLPRVAEVVAKKAYLNVGMGTDRLGGARYGYLEEGVKLKVIGRLQNNYKVHLTPSLSAWIPVEQVNLLPEGTKTPESITGNIRITGNSREDVITLGLSQKLPYTSTQQLNPNEILVNVYGATSNTNWKTQHLSAEGIEEVEWRQLEDGLYQLRIKLNHKQNWGYSVGYGWGTQLTIKIRRAPKVTSIESPLAGLKIAVDAGHGGENNGSLGSTGLMEKDVTLQISQKLDSVLQARGATVLMTREDDDYVFMSERADMIIADKSDLLVSIHANSLGYTSDPFLTKGTGAFYKHTAFKPLADVMYHKMLELGLTQYGVTGSFNFSLNAPTEFPNVLVETAFMSHPEEEILLSTESFQIQIAEQIADGLEEYFLDYADVTAIELDEIVEE